MSFVLRIFFTGLVAFVPSRDGKELTVLLPQAGQGYVASDHSGIESHHALLLARAAKCKGDCRGEDPAITTVLFPDTPRATAREWLSAALRNGAAWQLDAAELSVLAEGADLRSSSPLRILRDSRRVEPGHPEVLPGSPLEARDFHWVADLSRIVPSAGIVDPALLKPLPPQGRIAARLRLRFGEISTYRLVNMSGKILPMRFQTLDGKAPESGYSQALADLVMAEIRVPRGEVEIVASRFGKGEKRSIKLAPENGILEIALLNIPKSHLDPHAGEGDPQQLPGPGKHFEMYYELAKTRPLARPVPYPLYSAASQSPSGERRETLGSKLLDALRFGESRGIYDRVICPVVQLLDGGE